MGKLEGKVAVVTGGTTGIGLATARRFHAEGARVFATGANPVTLERARTELHGIAEVVPSDAGDAGAVRHLFAHVSERAGGLDVLFLNAGVVEGGSIVDMPEEAFDAILRVNVKGPWLALKAATPHFRRGGAVVLNGSINGHLGMPGTSAYAASKAALRALARVAASELAPRGVRVNVVSPGPTDSGILAKMMGPEAAIAKSAELVEGILLGRMGRDGRGRGGRSLPRQRRSLLHHRRGARRRRRHDARLSAAVSSAPRVVGALHLRALCRRSSAARGQS